MGHQFPSSRWIFEFSGIRNISSITLFEIQYLPSKVMEGGAAFNDGRISVGDRLVAVKNLPTGDFFLENCTHEESVQVPFFEYFFVFCDFCLF